MSALDRLYPWRFLVATIVTGLTFLARAGLQPVLGERGRVVLFTLAVTFSAMCGGFGAGLLATVLSAILIAVAIFEPQGLLALGETANLLTLLLFALVGISISGLSGELHKTRRRLDAERRRSDEQNDKLKQEITQRLQIESALRESQERFKAFMDHNPAMAFIKDAEGRFLYANPTWEQFHTADWQGKTVADLWPADEAGRITQTDRRVLDQHEKVEAFEAIRDPDGSLRHRMVVKFPLSDAAGREYIGGFSLDITERRRAEESLRLSEERFNAFMDRSPAIAFMKDDAGRYIYANQTWEELYGLNWRGKTDAELWPGDNVAMFRESDRRAREAGHATEAFETVLDKHGRPQDWWVLKFPIVDAEGNRLLGGMAMDISERKSAERALLESELKLHGITAAMPGAVYQFQFRPDGQQGFLSVSDGIYDLIGHTATEVVSDFSLLWDKVVAEDVQALTDSILRSAQTMMPWEFEGRLRMPNQTIKWIRGHSIPEPRRPDGSIVWNGLLTDVTDRKYNEQEVSRLAAIVEGSGDAIFSRDLDFRITSWNAAAERLFGYTAAEAVGRLSDFLIPKERFPDVAQRRSVIHHGHLSPPVDSVWLRKDGHEVHVSVTQSPIKDAHGELAGVSLAVRDIRERKSAELALRESERHLSEAEAIAHLGSWAWDISTGRNFWSDENYRLFGFVPGSVEPDFDTWIGRVHPDDRQPVLDHIQAVFQGKEAYDVEYRVVHGGGEIVYVHARGDVQRDAHGTPIYMAGSVQDITKRRLAEIALEVSERSLRRLYEITNSHEISFDQRVISLLQLACERFNVASGAVTRFRDEVVELDYVHSPTGELVERGRIPLSIAYCSSVVDRVEPLGIAQVGESELKSHKGYLALGFETYLGARIIVDGQIFGALCFVAKEPHAGAFTEADKNFLKLMSGWIGGELSRREAEQEVQNSHTRLRQVIDATPNFIFARDGEGRYTMANKALADAYGTSVENLIGKTDADFNSNAAAVVSYRKMDLQVMESGQELFIPEQSFSDANGRQCWLQTVKRPIYDDAGRANQVLGVSTDITARKLAELALRESERHLIAAQAIAHLGSWEWDFQTGRAAWSDEYARILGYEPGSVEPSYDLWIARIHADDQLRVREHLGAVFNGSANCDIEYRVVQSSGEIRHVHWRGELFRDAAGDEVRLQGTALDITEQKCAEEALRHAHDELERRVAERTVELQQAVLSLTRTEALLQQAIDVADLGVFERDHQIDGIYYSPTLNKILDLPRDKTAVLGDYDSKIHADDRSLVAAARQRARNPAGHGHFSLEHRIVRRDGSIGWVINRAQTFFEGVGETRTAARTVGAVLDITERKRAEELLRKNQEWLNQAVDVANLGIFEHDFVTRVLTYSGAFRRMLDWPDDLAPSTREFLRRVHPDDRQRVCSGMRDARGSLDGLLALEFRVIRQDGSIGWLLARSRLFFDGVGEDRRLIRGVGAALDITERKQTEETLRTSEERLQHAVAVGRMGIWERDLRSGKITWDDRVYEMLGIGKGISFSRDLLLAHVHPADLPVMEEAIGRCERDRQDFECETRFLRPDGKMIWILAHGGLRCDANGVATHIAGINLDITERKAVEEALRNLNERLDQRVVQRTHELAESQAGLRALVAELTKAEERERRRLAVELHDTLAQSLALVNMYLWRVGELAQDPAQIGSLKEVLGQLDKTVGDSVQYTRSLIAQLSPPVLYDLGLPAAFRWLSQQMRKHDLHVEVAGPQEGVSLAQDDAVMIFQCVRELLWNVVKHAKARKALVSYVIDDGQFVVAVSDDGKGFDPTRLDEESNGSGHFGLFSIRERVGFKGGRCEISAPSGGGARIELRLPVGPVDLVERKSDYKSSRQRRSVPAGDLIRIAIVDDHKMLRQGLRRVLEEHGRFTVVGEAGDGADAVALAREVQPQVVLMDVNLPTMSGIDATLDIMQDQPSTIVIGMSFGSDDYVVQAMQAAGAVTCLPKERAVEDISQAIMDALDGRNLSLAH